jgi:hypothetical protein
MCDMVLLKLYIVNVVSFVILNDLGDMVLLKTTK